MEVKVKTDGGYAATVDSDALDECRNEVIDAIGNGASYDEISDIVSGDLGLEMDYIFDIIGM